MAGMMGRDERGCRVTVRTLTTRELNRALLGRQLLLGREALPVSEVIGRLAGLQAQVPDAPYVGLWSRLPDFRPDELARMVATGRAVRLTLMRGTIHLVTVEDCLTMQPLFHPMIVRRMSTTQHGKDLGQVALRDVVAEGQRLLGERSMSRIELGTLLAQRWPGVPPASLGFVATAASPTLQVPPRGVWRQASGPVWAPIETFVGRRLADPLPIADLIRRYLAAFGPASVADIGRWSGLTGLGPVVRQLRPELRVFRGPTGTELFDIEDGRFPDPETAAPPRFLGEYDNVLLSHADRSRIMAVQELPGIPGGYGASEGTVLIDGMLGAIWTVDRDDGTIGMTVTPYESLSPDDERAVAVEGEALLRFIDPMASGFTVRFAAAGRPYNPWAAAGRRRRGQP